MSKMLMYKIIAAGVLFASTTLSAHAISPIRLENRTGYLLVEIKFVYVENNRQQLIACAKELQDGATAQLVLPDAGNYRLYYAFKENDRIRYVQRETKISAGFTNSLILHNPPGEGQEEAKVREIPAKEFDSLGWVAVRF